MTVNRTKMCSCTICRSKSQEIGHFFPSPSPPVYHPNQTIPYDEQDEIRQLKERIAKLEKAIQELAGANEQ